jgi:hypothetical protein
MELHKLKLKGVKYMFLIIGKGSFTEESLIKKLTEWKIFDAVKIVAEVKQKGCAFVGNYRIYSVKM